MNMIGNNSKLKQVLISPVIANLESPLDGRAINPSSFRNSSRTKILQQSKVITYLRKYLVCEVDSSKMKDTSSLEYDDHNDNNLYNLTLSSKVHTVGERSGSRSRAMLGSNPRTNKGGESVESAISTIPSVKHNKRQPPVSLVPSIMAKIGQAAPETLRIKKASSDLIKISDESRNKTHSQQ